MLEEVKPLLGFWLLKLKMRVSNDRGWLVLAGPETKKQVKKARKSGGLSGTSSDESNSDDSDKDVESDDSFKSVSSGEEDEDDFNPFKDDSSEDEEDGENLVIFYIVTLYNGPFSQTVTIYFHRY